MMELNIRKDQWVKTKLLDVFIKKEENDKANAHDRFDRFLKVEHMDAQSLNLKRWASQEKGDEINPTFYKIFRKGQILFPTRNPHLKRTALASFDGICGEKTLTLEPNIKLVIPEFIPFLFHSESFYEHTTSAIIGSTNPHVRWRDVANYEFLLPPKDQQAQLAELLWAMDEVIETDLQLINGLENLYNSSSLKYFLGKETILKKEVEFLNTVLGMLPAEWELKDFSEIADLIHGHQFRDSDFTESGIPIVKIGEIGLSEELELGKCSFIDATRLSEFESKIIRNGDILMALTGYIGRMCLVQNLDQPVLQNYRVGKFVITDSSLNTSYFYHLLKSPVIQNQIANKIHEAAQGNIGKGDIEKLKIPLPSHKEQEAIAHRLNKIQDQKSLLISKLTSSKSLQKSLINQTF